MAAITMTESFDTATPILLLYVSRDDRLAATMYNYQSSRSWVNASAFFNVSQYATAPGSRSLALSQAPDTNNSNELSLWFASSGGEVTGLLGSHAQVLPHFSPTVLDPFWSWTDIASTLEAGLPVPKPVLGTPFSITPTIYFGNTTNTPTASRGLWAMYFIPNAPPEASILYAEYFKDTWSASG